MTTATYSSGRTGRLRGRVLRHYLPLLLFSVVLISVLHITYYPVVRISFRSPDQAPTQHGAAGTTHSSGGDASQIPPELRKPGTVMRVDGNEASETMRSSQVLLFFERISVATGYTALLFIGATLVIGPLNLYRRRGAPVSLDLRRDIGIWAAILSGIHVLVGLQVHTNGDILRYFVSNDLAPLLTTFGWANYVGLAATVVVLLLAGLSNDRLLRKLGAKRWKRLQQLNYALFALVIIHAILYELFNGKRIFYPITLGVIAIMVVLFQMLGIWVRRSRVGAVRPVAK
jgi:methionine sulfoxide reductase heme-binding subunit